MGAYLSKQQVAWLYRELFFRWTALYIILFHTNDIFVYRHSISDHIWIISTWCWYEKSVYSRRRIYHKEGWSTLYRSSIFTRYVLVISKYFKLSQLHMSYTKWWYTFFTVSQRPMSYIEWWYCLANVSLNRDQRIISNFETFPLNLKNN